MWLEFCTQILIIITVKGFFNTHSVSICSLCLLTISKEMQKWHKVALPTSIDFQLKWNENTVLWFLYSPFVLELVKRLNFNNRVFCVCIEAVIEVHIVHFELQLGKKASRSHVLKMHNKLVEKWALLLATAYLHTKSELTLIFCISQVANDFTK